MKALVLKETGLSIEAVEEGPLHPGHARLQVLQAGLCGSDMHRIHKPIPGASSVLGHEFVGRILEFNPLEPDSCSPIQIGDVAAACPTLPCGGCPNCRTQNDHLCHAFHSIGRDVRGAFAERVDVPLSNLAVVPENIPYKPVVLADVVAVCLHAIDEIAGDVLDKTCLVIGDGAIGTVLAAVLSRRGAKTVSISGKYTENYDLLSSISSVQRADGNDRSLYDCVFETVGRTQLASLEQAIARVAIRGKIIALGVFPPGFPISFDNRALFLKEASLSASVAYKKDSFFRAVQFLMQNPDLAQLITHEFPILDYEKGVELMNNKWKSPPVIKIVYNFDSLS